MYKKKIDNADNITILKRVCRIDRSLLLSVLSLLQIPTTRESTLSPPIREVRNEKELTKSVSAIDPANLLSPTSHHHPDEHEDAVLQQPLSSLGNEQSPGVGWSRCVCLSFSAYCAVRTQPSRLRLVFRAPAHARGGRRWSECAKPQKKSQITRLPLSSSSALVLSLSFILSPFRRFSTCVCGISICS